MSQLIFALLMVVNGTPGLATDKSVIAVDRAEFNTFRLNPEHAHTRQLILYRWGYWPDGKYGYRVTEFFLVRDQQLHVRRRGEFFELSWPDKNSSRMLRLKTRHYKPSETSRDPEIDDRELLPLADRDRYFTQ